MPRPRKQMRNRWTRQGVDGYIRPRNGVAWMYYSTRRRTTGLRFDPVNKEHALDMLQEWVRDCKAEDLGLRTGPPIDRTVGELVERFVQIRMSDATIGRIRHHTALVNHFLVPIEHLRLRDVDQISHALSQSIRKPRARRPEESEAKTLSPLAPSTLRRYIRGVRHIFRFGRQIGWVDRDPTAVLVVPDDVGEGFRAVPWEVATRAIAVVYERDEEMGELLEFVLLTAARNHEVRGLRRYQLREDHIDIRGKGVGRRPGESHADWWHRKPQRIVPLYDTSTWPESEVKLWQRSLVDLVDRITRRVGEDPQAHLWPARSTKSKELFVGEDLPNNHFKEALRAIGVDDAYSVHGLRKTTEHWFEASLGLDPFVFCDITGHDVRTYVKDYRQARTAGDLIRAIARTAGAPEASDIRTIPTVIIDRSHPHTASPSRRFR